MPPSTSTLPPPTLVWLRRDLRLLDNPALAAAAASGQPIIPVFIDDENAAGPRLGGATRWWRGRSLAALCTALEERGSRLTLRKGGVLDDLLALVRETGADSVHINRRFEPRDLAEDAQIITQLRGIGIEIHEHLGNRLHEPWALKTLKGDPFRVFTPFWRRLAESYQAPRQRPMPKSLAAPAAWPESAKLIDFQVTAPWTAGMAAHWQPGEIGALALMAKLKEKLPEYDEHRNRPDLDGTSRLSPHLAWGEISVHDIWRRLADAGQPAQNAFLRELGWRDFNTHLLYHFPKLPEQSWNAQFADFPFVKPDRELVAWQQGLTGYPIVDAGMRELWSTGWMHNRVRMIVASFLIKDLLIDWRLGQAWFWDTLVDADLAQNAGNWQWVAGSGADAAPYFRIFNPITQGIKFDPDGSYIKHWVPELARLPTALLHDPASAAPDLLARYGVHLGKNYPRPIVDHAEARQRALATYKSLPRPGATEAPERARSIRELHNRSDLFS